MIRGLMPKVRRRVVGGAVAATAVACLVPAVAHAEWELSPGDTITMTAGNNCSVGYFASDSDGLYIVTAGHCTEHTNTEVTADGERIGKVVAGYNECPGGSCSRGRYGITIIQLYRGTGLTLNHWWTSAGDASRGDKVCISGAGERATRCGTVDESTSTVTNVVGAEAIAGDSGSGAWGGPDHKLVGLVISGGDGETQVQPISDAQAKARSLGYDLSILVA